MEKTAQELNDNLLRCDLFKCKHCRFILRSPIVYVENEGNFCWSCASNFTQKRRNYEVENVLSKLTVPCRFSINGCRIQGKPNLIEQHEMVCSFHNLVCPFTCLNECNEESIVNIIEHFEKAHTHSIITTDTSDIVKLCFHINTLYNQLNLLVINGDKFLLHIVRDVGEMHYFVYYMGDVESINEFSCVIEHTVDDMKIEVSAVILPESNYPNLDRTKAATFNMRFLREIFKDNINVSIRIISKCRQLTAPCSDNNEKFLTCFECPVCNGYMRPPIYQCLSGHSICNKCRARVANCPTCRLGYGNTRNYVLESLSSGIKYPCLFRESGCELYFSVNDINRHEDECPLRPINCPFSGYLHCGWAGPLSKIAGHLKSAHPEQTVCDNIYTETIAYSDHAQFYHMKALLAYGKVFRVCHQRHIGDQNGYWSVQVVGAKGEANKYTCHVSLTDLKCPSRSLVRTDVCQDFSTLDVTFHHCIVIPLSVVSSFSTSGKLQLIYKVVN